jgi:hypothetical protein
MRRVTPNLRTIWPSEYVRSYPADPHTEVLAKFIDRLEFVVLKLRRIEGVPLRAIAAIQAQDEAQMGEDPNAQTVITSDVRLLGW